MRDSEIALLVEGHAVGAAGAARQLDEDADLDRVTFPDVRYAPDVVTARGGDEQSRFIKVQHHTVRTWNGVQQTFERPHRSLRPGAEQQRASCLNIR